MGCYFILSGRVQITTHSDPTSGTGRHHNQTLAIFGKGTCLAKWPCSRLRPGPGRHTHCATQLAYLSRAAFEQVLDKYPRGWCYPRRSTRLPTGYACVTGLEDKNSNRRPLSQSYPVQRIVISLPMSS